MNRFFLPNQKLNNEHITIDDPTEIHHLKNVLRLKENSEIQVFNGTGNEIIGQITGIQKNAVTVKVVQDISSDPLSRAKLILACAIPKKAKFENIIEKCTELGVDQIIPLITQRTEVKLPPDRIQNKLKRYQTVAINAAKQSKRKTVPIIHPITEFKKFVQNFDDSWITFIPWLSEQQRTLPEAVQRLKVDTTTVFIIGPEGDFTPGEIQLAKAAGSVPITLGSTVLKVDTAAISVVAFYNLNRKL